MKNLKLYEVTEEYIHFLQEAEPMVFSTKDEQRKHNRKYLGIVLDINDYKYYVPLSSPNESDLSYKTLVQKELLFIRKNSSKIKSNAALLYKQKNEKRLSIGYLKNTVNFSLLEKEHDKYLQNQHS